MWVAGKVVVLQKRGGLEMEKREKWNWKSKVKEARARGDGPCVGANR